MHPNGYGIEWWHGNIDDMNMRICLTLTIMIHAELYECKLQWSGASGGQQQSSGVTFSTIACARFFNVTRNVSFNVVFNISSVTPPAVKYQLYFSLFHAAHIRVIFNISFFFSLSLNLCYLYYVHIMEKSFTFHQNSACQFFFSFGLEKVFDGLLDLQINWSWGLIQRLGSWQCILTDLEW